MTALRYYDQYITQLANARKNTIGRRDLWVLPMYGINIDLEKIFWIF